MGRRPKQPKRRFPGVSAVWGDGKWKWRALMRVGGKQVVGPRRQSQDEAYEDRRRMEATSAVLPDSILTLGEAIDAVVAAAKTRGLPQETLNKTFRAHGTYLLSFWRPETPLSKIDSREIEWFITEASKSVDEEGEPKRARSPNTRKQKDLPLLRRCFEIANLPTPQFSAPKLRPPELHLL